jgi:alcohol dehydrogenase YqhD (iron-dependent ADH family)
LLTVINETPKVLSNPNDYDARANLMWAGMVAHNDICGVGREQDWSSHGMEHELSGLYDVAHGIKPVERLKSTEMSFENEEFKIRKDVLHDIIYTISIS